MSHIFISYSRKDTNDAESLANNLLRHGFAVWIDKQNIPGSVVWQEEINEVIRKADVLIVIMTPASRESEWVQREINFARAIHKPIIPVLLEGENWYHFSDIQYLDAREGKYKWHELHERLVTTLDYAAPASSFNLTWVWIALLVLIALIAVLPFINLSSVFTDIIKKTPDKQQAAKTATWEAMARQTQTAYPYTPTVTATPTISVTPTSPEFPTAVPAANQATEVALNITDASGQLIGNGTLRLYAPNKLSYSESALVELELSFDELYITPTPAGPITAIPVHTLTPFTSTPTATPTGGTARPTRTPTFTPTPIHTKSAQAIYRLMGASLLCSDDRFSGCDREDVENYNAITLEGASWSWFITPKDSTDGLQDFQIVVWRVLPVDDGSYRTNRLWDYNFKIDVRAKSEKENTFSPEIIVAIIGAIGLVLAALAGRQWTQGRKSEREEKPVVRSALLKVFISYRRDDSEGTAGRIYDRMKDKFAKDSIFRDVDTIHYGADFEKAIDNAVSSCDVLLAVIGKKWLTLKKDGKRRIDDPNDFVHLEIAKALQKNKTVIPILVHEAKMPAAEDLPDDLKKLASLNAISIRNESFDDDVQRLIAAIEKG